MERSIENTEKAGPRDLLKALGTATRGGRLLFPAALKETKALYGRHRGFAGKDHTIEHTMRVLLYAVCIFDREASGIEEAVKKKLFDTLTAAVIYHDVGRKDDFDTDTHGDLSADIYRKESVQNDPVAEALIRGHNKIDTVSKMLVTEAGGDKNALLLHNIIKDADALDRFRFAGADRLDESCLRTETARMITDAAKVISSHGITTIIGTLPQSDEKKEKED